MGSSFPRRRFWVSTRLQKPFVLMALGHVALFAVITAGTLFLPLMDAPAGGTTPKAWMLFYLNHRFWPAAVVGVVFVALHAAFVSHRVAGPLLRMRRALQEASRGGAPDPVRLRDGDYLHPEAEALNELLRVHVRHRDEAAELLKAAQAELEEGRCALAAGDRETVERCASSLEDRRRMLSALWQAAPAVAVHESEAPVAEFLAG